MTFEDFTVPELIRRFQLAVHERSLFANVAEHAPSEWLTAALKETAPIGLTLGNEKARSEMIIAPILVEVRRSLDHRVSRRPWSPSSKRSLTGPMLTFDTDEYLLPHLGKILGIFRHTLT